MGKKGPCHHCGIHYTPLWRNGPPEKPVLCNACGSRYRVCGSLENYVPKHAQSLAGQSSSGVPANTRQNLTQGRLNPSSGNSPPTPSMKRSNETMPERSEEMDRFIENMQNLLKQDNKWKRSSSSSAPQEEVLIKGRANKLIIPENEIGLGAMLLKPDDDAKSAENQESSPST